MTSTPWKLAAAAGLGLCASCYFGAGIGPSIPVGAPASSSVGVDAALELGLTYDIQRLVRLSYFGSLQASGGTVFTAAGQRVVAPLGGALQVDVTVWKFDPSLLLRLTGRGYYGFAHVRVGEGETEVEQPGSSVHGGLLGVTLHLVSTPEQSKETGPAGLFATAGVLVARADASAVGSPTFVVPMIVFGIELSPPHILWCYFATHTCRDKYSSSRN